MLHPHGSWNRRSDPAWGAPQYETLTRFHQPSLFSWNVTICSVMWNWTLTSRPHRHLSLGGDCHPRTTSAHFPATIVIWKDAAERRVYITPKPNWVAILPSIFPCRSTYHNSCWQARATSRLDDTTASRWFVNWLDMYMVDMVDMYIVHICTYM